MKFNDTLCSFVQKNIQIGKIPMLVGEPGIGKSSWLSALASLMHTKVFEIPCNQLAEKADLTGGRIVPMGKDKNGEETFGQKFFPHYDINEAIQYADEHPTETPILFLDEINRTSSDVTSAALSLATSRKLGSVYLPKNLRIVTAGNDKGNINVLDKASISRFVLYHVTPDLDTFLAVNKELNPYIQETLKKHPEALLCTENIAVAVEKTDDNDSDETSIEEVLDIDDDMKQFTTPRTITALSDFLNTFSDKELLAAYTDTYKNEDDMMTSALEEAIIAHVGNTQFTAFLMDEIASNIARGGNQNNVVAIPKPNIYDQMKACPDYSTLEQFVSNMNDSDKSGCLVYAISENVDNKIYIEVLSANITQFDSRDLNNFITAGNGGRLNHINLQHFLNTSNPAVSTIGLLAENW